MKHLRFALTPGEPAGIGPDLIIQLAQKTLPAELVVIADPLLLQARAQQLGLPLRIHTFQPENLPQTHQAGELMVLPVSCTEAVVAGELNSANAQYVIDTLTIAAQGCLNGQFAGIITGPVHKGIVNEAGIQFSGHTEFFAAMAHAEQVVMLLATDNLRVALVTTHLPLHAVPDAITRELLNKTLNVLQQGLRRYFGIAEPRILVCGLNPHAGEGGHLGQEEITVIEPVLTQLRAEGMQLIGPLSADTLFTPKQLMQGDVVLAMYHDQGLPVLKYAGFGQAVNVTLGLPFIRTSVDHGTALPLAGTGQADASSFLAAIKMAINMAEKKSV